MAAYTNPETGSEIEEEPDGDYTVTFSMTLPAETISSDNR